jgi:ADP-heptose:LPS heptosyltransferase/glycosyltransferase involved in cell wall biosynthesis
MKCPVCGIDVPQLNKDRIPCGHLFVVKSAMDEHIHIHGDLENKPLMKELLTVANEEAKIDITKIDVVKSNILTQKEIIFHNRQRIGDILMFTCAVRDFKAAYPDIKVNVISTAMHIWDHNPNIDNSIKPYYKNGKTLQTITANDFMIGDTNVLKIGPGKGTNQSNRIDWHFANAFRISIEDNLGIHIPQGNSHPDIWLTEEEYNAPRITSEPYWILVIGGEKGWGCKMYPFERWQEFVNQNPSILFYQLGATGDNHPRLQGKNVVDYVGMTEDKNTGIRDLFKLFLNAEGSIGLVSFHMHLASAFPGKPCIVVAGAREPVSFTQYPCHRYLATDGALTCGYPACWHCDIANCEDKTEAGIPRCVDLIKPEDLTRALNLYYDGGRLKKEIPSEKPKFNNIGKDTPQAQIAQTTSLGTAKTAIVGPDGKFIKLVSTARGWGGCARSVTTIMKFLVQAGHRVEFIPFRNKVGSHEFQQFLKEYPQIIVTENYNTLSEACDVLFVYGDDYIWEFEKPEIVEAFSNLNAKKKIMMLNYRRGRVGEIPWTKGWDKYMFLNSTQERDLLSILPGIQTKVLPPCTELEEFLKITPNYNSGIRIVRVSSQGDTKFAPDFGNEVQNILSSRPDVEIALLPGPSFIITSDRIKKSGRTANPTVIADFLSKGNLFWYSLPIGYMDMGPRVVLEAMAAGLPILADNWGGVVDRVTPECGWLCESKDQMAEIVKNLTFAELLIKGEAAKKRAMDNFIPERWIEEILC